jgi:glycosyltransferase involved in cell wall biosynthesis
MNQRHPNRLLHVHSGNLYGGIERVLITLAAQSTRHRFALAFTGQLADELRATREAGATAEVQTDLVRILAPVRFSRPWTVSRFRDRLSHLLANEHPDVVLCHAPWSYALAAPVARQRDIPLALWLHGVFTGRPWLERLTRRIQPDVLIGNSQFTAGTAASFFPRVPQHVVYPPVPFPTVPSASDQASGPTDVVIIQVARPEPGKGLLLHIEALKLMADDPSWSMWFVGGARRSVEAKQLRLANRAADRAGLGGRVRFLGARSDVPQLLTRAHIYCQPNTAPEGFGITLIEAMQAGLPVVTTEVGAAAELVDQSSGLLVPPDATAVAAQLRSLCSDPAQRKSLGSAGPERARLPCDPSAQELKLLDALGSVIS